MHLLSLVKTNEQTVSRDIKVRMETVSTVVEMLKSLFYCGDNGVRAGFSIQELEGVRYKEFRDTLKIVHY